MSLTKVQAEMLQAGAGSGTVNFLSNGNADSNTLGWNLYQDAAGTSPVDGTGGTPTGITFTRSTSSPLVGNASFILSKDAANRQGAGVSTDFTIDSAFRAKVLQINFEYQVNSGTFVAGSNSADSDVTVWLYDITNAQIIQPTTFRLFSNSSSLSTSFVSNFQTSSNSTSYRLIMHMGSTSASAYSLKLDSVVVQPSEYAYSSSMTVQSSRIAGTGTLGVGATITGALTTSSGYALYSYNSGTGVYTALQNCTLSLSSTLTTGTTQAQAAIEVNSITVAADFDNVGGANSNASWSGPILAGQTFRFFNSSGAGNSSAWQASVAASGLLNVQTSDQADSRVVAFQANSTSTQSITTGVVTKITGWGTPSVDTHGAWSAINQQYAIPVSGVYRFNFNQLFNNVATAGIGSIHSRIRVNGSDVLLGFVAAGGTASQQRSGSVAGIASLRAGDIVEFFSFQDTGTTLTMTATGPNATIERLSQASLISATETVAMRATKNSGSHTTSGSIQTVASWMSITNPATFDSHNAFNTTTGVYTCPVAGRYAVSGTITLGVNGIGTFRGIYINKNGSIYALGNLVPPNSVIRVGMSFSTIIQCNAGDTISLGATQDCGGSLGYSTSADDNQFCIQRIGL